MKTILAFFFTWFLFGAAIYLIVSISQGNLNTSLWDTETREGVSVVAGLGGFIFSVFAIFLASED